MFVFLGQTMLRFRPGMCRLLQLKQTLQQLSFLQLLQPHQLQDQESRHQPQDVFVGPHTFNTSIDTQVSYNTAGKPTLDDEVKRNTYRNQRSC